MSRVVYRCDLCSFETSDSHEAAHHTVYMNEGVRNLQWKHEIIPVIVK